MFDLGGFEDRFLSDAELDAEFGDAQGEFPNRLPDSQFMDRFFGPPKQLPSNPPPVRDDTFSVEVDGY